MAQQNATRAEQRPASDIADLRDFLLRLREERGHEDARANEDYRAPMRKVHFVVAGTTGHVWLIAETDQEARDTFNELAPDHYEVDEIFPTDDEIDELSDRLESHLHRTMDRCKMGEVREALR